MFRDIINWLKELDKKAIIPRLSVDEQFEDFIGNEEAVRLLKLQISSYLKTGEKIEDIALFGPKSTGKTSLAKILCACLRLPMLRLTRGHISKEKHFLDALTPFLWKDENSLIPCVIFIDEAHLLNRKLQDSLLTALEKNDNLLSFGGYDFDVKNVIWVIATTNPEKLGQAFKSRFLEINLNPYSVEEMKEIILINTKRLKTPIPLSKNELTILANASRYIPRKAISLLQMWASIKEDKPEIKMSTFLEDYFGIDVYGFTKMDKKYIGFLEKRNSASLAQLASYMELDRIYIQEEIEPFLVRKGLLSISSKGRMLG